MAPGEDCSDRRRHAGGFHVSAERAAPFYLPIGKEVAGFESLSMQEEVIDRAVEWLTDCFGTVTRDRAPDHHDLATEVSQR